jgi:hypothetical protein
MHAVQKLRSYLASKELCGSGVDCRISAFFRPQRNGLSQSAIEDLDKANVELVWVSAKQEDADRKIVARISQESSVLEPSKTVFVLISGDADFRSSLEPLRGQGFRVILIHDYDQDQGERALQALSMHANEVVQWRVVLNLPANNVTTSHRCENKEELTEHVLDRLLSVESTESDHRPSYCRKNVLNFEKNSVQSYGVESSTPQQVILGWFPVKWIRWQGSYGFLSTSAKPVTIAFTALSIVPQDLLDTFTVKVISQRGKDDDMRVYVGHTVVKLYQPETKSVDRGTKAVALIALCSKGLRAVKLRSEIEFATENI